MSIDVARVKEYNKKYRECTLKVSELKAKIDLANKTIDDLCNELTNELGVQVTRDNAHEIYAKYTKEINEKLQIGEEILNRIASEEIGNTVPQQNMYSEPVAQPQTQQAQTQNQAQPQMVQQSPFGTMEQNVNPFGAQFNAVPSQSQNQAQPQMTQPQQVAQGATPADIFSNLGGITFVQ